MAAVALDENRLKTLSVFGDVDKLVSEAIDDYLNRKIIERIRMAHAKSEEFEKKYSASYAAFSERMALQQTYYAEMNQLNPLWEQDSHQWEYWQGEAREWTERLNAILNKS